MSGVSGMTHKVGRGGAVRRKMWQSMRILRRFTLPDIVRTAPGASYGNARKFVSNLEHHGYVAKAAAYNGGRAGEYQIFTLVKDIGPEYPTLCSRCGGTVQAKICFSSSEEKEREKERNGEKERERGVSHDRA